MATNQMHRVIQTLHRATQPHPAADLTDGQLLERYIRSREEAAFAALVHRHGPMVWGVCRRVLRTHHDADDAFQATFLVLVRKATSVMPRDMVANWLYGVAHFTALKARATSARREAREKQVMTMPEKVFERQERWEDLQALLDQELSRLPDKYRSVIVLCDLEGKTRREAARHFRLPEGTVATRLATARGMLARRLTRRGLALSGSALAAVLSQQVAAATMPLSVATTTIKAAGLFASAPATATPAISARAAALADGVLKARLLAKLKLTVALLLFAMALAAGTAAIIQQALALAPAAALSPLVMAERPADQPANKQVQQAVQPIPEKKAPAEVPREDKKAEQPLPTLLSGVVKTVDAANGTVTVVHRDGETTFSVAKDASIIIDDAPAKLISLPAQANVNLKQFIDQTTVRSIQAYGGRTTGIVKAVDAQSKVFTVTNQGEDRTVTVGDKTFISIDGKAATVAKIPKGSTAHIDLCADQTTCRNVTVEGTPANGIVKALDLKKRRITITLGQPPEDRTFDVAKDVQVDIDWGKSNKLSDLPVGASVGATVRTDQRTICRIQANGSSDFGTVKAVDAVNNTITVIGGPPNERIYNVPPDAPIAIDGQPGKLAAIPVGANLHALNLRVDQKTVSSINVVGPGFHNVPLKAVDADQLTITFDDSAPRELAGKTLAVAKDAHIDVDGKPGRLAAVPAGAFGSLGLSVDRQTIRNLQAEGPTLGGCGGSCVIAVDVANRTITFDDRAPADIAGKTFTVAKDATFAIDGRRADLAGLPPGSYVNATLTVDRQTIRHIGAQGPPVAGVLNAVDAAKNTITVDGTTYTLAADISVAIDGQRGQLSSLTMGSKVSLRLHVDQRTVASIHVNMH